MSFTDLFSYNNLTHAFAGATGSVVGMSTFYPLDTVRTRLQTDDDLKAVGPFRVMKQLSEEEGVGTLYRGLTPVLTSLYCSNFVYFYAFNGMKTIANLNGIKPSISRDLIFGYLSGCINALVTTPLWVVNTRLKLQCTQKTSTSDGTQQKKLDGLFHGLCTISKEEGMPALWNGVQTSFILSGNPAIHFMVYESLKRFFFKTKLAKGQKTNLSSFESFLLGGFAKAVATVITYPLQLVQCRQRATKKTGSNVSIYEVVQGVLRQAGILGLYKGMESKLYQTVLTAALMFLTYEKILSVIYWMFRVQKKNKQ